MLNVVFCYPECKCTHNTLATRGCDGTHGPMLAHAEELARQGHRVTVVSDHVADVTVDGVVYTKAMDDKLFREANYVFPACFMIENMAHTYKKHLALEKSHSFFERYRASRSFWSLLRLFSGRGVCIMMQTLTTRRETFLLFKQLYPSARIVLLGPSDHVTQFYRHQLADVPDIRFHTVINAIDTRLFAIDRARLSIPQKHGMCFFPCYERGGRVAREVAANLQLPFHTQHPGRDDAHLSAAALMPYRLGKRDVIAQLLASDYFVYPLVASGTPWDNGTRGQVHHDCCANCIHEAMACGVIVITWDVGPNRSLYGDSIILLAPPPCTGYDPGAPTGSNEHMLSAESIDLLVRTIQSLESDPLAKLVWRERALQWAYSNTYKEQFNIMQSILSLPGE